MQKTLQLVFLLLFSNLCQAQSYYEPFLIPSNSPLTNKGWAIHSGGTSNPINTVASLALGNVESPGMAVRLKGSGQDLHQNFGAVTEGQLYFSVWVQVQKASSSGDYFLHLGPRQLGSNFCGRIYVKATKEGKLAFGVSKSSHNPQYTPAEYQLHKSYLLVLKYSFNSHNSHDDLVQLSVLGSADSYSHEFFEVQAKPSEADAKELGIIALRQGSRSLAPELILDELKVSKSWDKATQLVEDPFVKLSYPNKLLTYTSNCLSDPLVEVSLSALGQSANLNIWSSDFRGLTFSYDGNLWEDQLRFYNKEGIYAENFFIKPKPTFREGVTEILIDDEEVNLVELFKLKFEQVRVRDDCSMTVADYRSQEEGFVGRVSGTITASAEEFGDFNYLQDPTGGIRINGDYGWAIGDSISFLGTKGEVFEETLIVKDTCCDSIDPIKKIGVGGFKVREVDLQDIESYEGSLVQLNGVTFDDPNFVFLPNTNELITKGSKSIPIRIWAATDIDGLAKSNRAQELRGVVGRFRDQIQLYPRAAVDVPAAIDYDYPPLAHDTENTFDVAAWNIEWFGSSGNGPKDDEQQLLNAYTTLKAIDADAIVLTEIANQTFFNRLVDKLGAYEGACSPAVSNGATSGNAQRVCLLYKKKTVTLEGVRPLLRNTPFINDYPGGFDRFWASGRLPALFICDVDINGVQRRLHLVGIHARANRSNSSERELVYNMRKKDLEVLKDTLDTQFSAASVIMLGDFNDDLDESVVQGISSSSYLSFVKDPQRWLMATEVLSRKGYKSFIGFDNVIDHIGLSNELFGSFIVNSVFLELPFTYIDNYPETTSDHLPVVARFLLEETLTSNRLLETDSLLVFPNPTSGILNINGIEENKEVLAKLRSQKAELLLSINGSKSKVERKITKVLSKSSSGIYLLELKVGNQSKSYKIVRQD